MRENTLTSDVAEQRENPPTCVYIAGYGRSGSTYLDMLLSTVPGVSGIGEACNIFHDLIAGGKCSCGHLIESCPYWGKFVERIDATALEAQRKRCEGIMGFFPCPANSIYQLFWDKFFQESARLDEVIVDSSKTNLGNFLRPVALKRIGVKIIFVQLYRNPLDILNSVYAGSNRDISAGITRSKPYRFMFAVRSFLGLTFSWFIVEVLAKIYFPGAIRLKYEEIKKDPGATLKILFPEAAIHADSLEIGHAIAGNRMRSHGPSNNSSTSNSAQPSRLLKAMFGMLLPFYR